MSHSKIYPIGTRIRYKGCVPEDIGKIGTIVGYVNDKIIWVKVPHSVVAKKFFGDHMHKWSTFLSDVEILFIPNRQLLFEFMYE